MKYIRTERLGIVLFHELLSHDDMARRICQKSLAEVVSAGFVAMGERPECYGRSLSLGIGSAGEDTAVLHKQMGWRS